MSLPHSATEGRLSHVVTLGCKDEKHATRCIAALANHRRPDALAFNCVSYEFGLEEGIKDTVCIVERWARWEDRDSLLVEKVVPTVPLYNELLKRPFDRAQKTARIHLSNA
jgi:hypothetical protein